MSLREADADDIDRVEALLAANDLPHRVVGAEPTRFFVATADGAFVGVGGVEVHGAAGLLRSVVVAESNRRAGYGTAVCDTLEERARDDGVETLYLLATTASGFFRDRGYEAIPREDASTSIRETTEFAELCPDAATCMRKDLA